jgi:hypothetical protein
MGQRNVIAVTKQTRDESAGWTPVVEAPPTASGSLAQLLACSCVLQFTAMTPSKSEVVVWVRRATSLEVNMLRQYV